MPYSGDPEKFEQLVEEAIVFHGNMPIQDEMARRQNTLFDNSKINEGPWPLSFCLKEAEFLYGMSFINRFAKEFDLTRKQVYGFMHGCEPRENWSAMMSFIHARVCWEIGYPNELAEVFHPKYNLRKRINESPEEPRPIIKPAIGIRDYL